MNAFIVTFFCVAVTIASAGWVKQIPSGIVGVSKDGALVAGPAGSIKTDNGLHGHGAGVRISGPSGDVRTRGGLVTLKGPGNGDDGGNWDNGDNGNWGNGNWNNGNWGNDGEDDGQWRGDNGNDGNDGQWGGDGWNGKQGVVLVAPISGGWGKGWNGGW